MLTEWLLLGVAAVLTAATGIFVAAEFAMVTVQRSEVEERAERGDRKSAAVLKALKQLSTQLSGAQVGITLTTLLLGFLAEPSIAALLRPALEATPVPDGWVGPLAISLALILATAVSMVAGELVPKNLALAVPAPTAAWTVPLNQAFTWATTPLIRTLNGTANTLLRRMGIEPAEELSDGRSTDELQSLVRRSAEQGTLDLTTATLLTRSIGFAAHSAVDVMTPRGRVEAIGVSDTAEQIIDVARRTGYSKFPVTGEDLDDIVGVIHVKHAIAVPHDQRSGVAAADIMSTPIRVPDSVRLDKLLSTLRGRGLQLAVVEDEYGGTAGVVTLEDLVEEIVGEVADEHDRAQSELRQLRDGTILMPGLMRPDQLREQLGLDVPDSSAYETVAGFVMAQLGKVAERGDELAIDQGVLRVSRMDGRRIDRIRFTPTEPMALVVHDGRVRSMPMPRNQSQPVTQGDGPS